MKEEISHIKCVSLEKLGCDIFKWLLFKEKQWINKVGKECWGMWRKRNGSKSQLGGKGEERQVPAKRKYREEKWEGKIDGAYGYCVTHFECICLSVSFWSIGP